MLKRSTLQAKMATPARWRALTCSSDRHTVHSVCASADENAVEHAQAKQGQASQGKAVAITWHDGGRGRQARPYSTVSNGPPGWQIVLIFVWVVYTVWLLREERGRQAPGQKIPSNIPVESCVRLHALRARSPDLTVLVAFRLLLGRTYR